MKNHDEQNSNILREHISEIPSSILTPSFIKED